MKKNNPIFSFFILVFLLSNLLIFGQEDFKFETLSIEKNDIQSVVYKSCYDKNGNVWFATEDGLVRFNSKESYIYNTTFGIPEPLGNRIYSILNDKKNNLWIGSEKGLALYDAKKDAFDLIATGPKKINRTNYLHDDNQGNIWVASNNGLWKYNQNWDPKITKHYFENLLVYSIASINSTLFILTNEGVYSLDSTEENLNKQSLKLINSNIVDGSEIKIFNRDLFIGTKSGKLYKATYPNSDFKEIFFSTKQFGLRIRDIELKDNHYYIAIDGQGIMVLDENYNVIQQYRNDEDDPNSISSNGVYDILFGKDGITWIATYGGGVNFIASSKQKFKILKHKINNENSLANNTTRAILEENNTIWFGTKKGISIYNRKTDNWNHIYKFPKNNSEEIILSFAQDETYVWAASYNHGLFRINKTNYEIVNVYDPLLPKNKEGVQKIFKVFIDSSKNIWLGGIDGLLTVIKKDNTSQNYTVRDIRDITEDKDGTIIAVGKEGVFFIDPKKPTNLAVEKLQLRNKNIQFNTINAVLATPKQIVIGTNGGGLLFYNKKTKKLTQFNQSHKLPSNIVQGIIENENEDYWISTTNGLTNIQFKSKDTLVKNLTKADGLSSNEFNYGSYLKLADGQLVFGGLEGVTLFNPETITARNVYPRIVFEAFFVNNQQVKNNDLLESHINETEVIHLKYNQNSFGFKFAGILQAYAPKVKYSFKLEGFDDYWSTPSNKNQINYTNISPGTYLFKVKASNETEEFGPEKTIQIVISSPWYATSWAYFIYFILFLSGIYALIKIIKILEIKKNKEEQISFFNNITHEIKTPLAILLTTLEDKDQDENLRVKSSIERINALINQMLNFQRFSFNENMQLQVSKIHLNDFIYSIINDFKPLLDQKNLTIEVNNTFSKELFYYDEDFLNKIIFNLISNAIKYSFENNKIIVTLEDTEDGKLLIKVKDFGIGIPKAAQKNILTKFFRAKNVMNNQFSGTGLGLMIVKNIVEKSNGKITFKSTDNKGTIFKVTLPSFEKLYSTTTILEKSNTDIEIGKEIEKHADKKVLVVEDNDDLRNYLVKTLENYFLVYEAKNGKEGLELSLNLFPDLILTDFMMPEMDGVEMCLKIKEDINLNHIPIFMLTALQNSVHKKESTEIGITEYIEKPINISFLLAKIISVFSWQENLRDHYMHLSDVDLAGKNKNSKENEFLEKLEAIILDKIKDDSFSLQDICNIIGMSRTSLYMKLKNLIDLSPQDFIIHTKLKFAKKLLIKGDANIKEVAYASGFSNPKYFSTSFKKAFGVSPSEFVKNLSK